MPPVDESSNVLACWPETGPSDGCGEWLSSEGGNVLNTVTHSSHSMGDNVEDGLIPKPPNMRFG